MKNILLWLCPVFLFLSGNTVWAETGTATVREYRMAWILTYNEDIKSGESIRKSVEEARKTGLNALLPIAHRRGRAYYNSSFLPVYNPGNISPPLDTLQAFIDAAHDTSEGKAYIEIHPWVVLFPVWLDDYDPPEKHIAALHPQWATRKYGEEPESSGRKPRIWLDPGVPGVCDYFVEVCREIVSRYDVDGLNLDYIRYYEGGHGYNPIALERFRKRYGRTNTPEPGDARWQEWQREQITNLVRRIYVETKMIKPRLKLSICSIVWGNPDKPFPESAFYSRVMQDWPSWFQEGIADINLPMNYRSEEDPQRYRDFRSWARICRKNSAGRLFVNGLGNYLNTISGSIAQIRAGKRAGADGSCLFRFGVNNSENKPYGTLLEALAGGTCHVAASPPGCPWLENPQTGMIRGFVKKEDGSRPVDGIKITLKGGVEKIRHTDGSGYFAFVGVAPGEYQVAVTAPGEGREEKRGVNVQKGRISSVDIDL